MGKGEFCPPDRFEVKRAFFSPQLDRGAALGAGEETNRGFGISGEDGLGKSEPGTDSRVVMTFEAFGIAGEVKGMAGAIPMVVAQVHHQKPGIAFRLGRHEAASLHVRLADEEVKIEPLASRGQDGGIGGDERRRGRRRRFDLVLGKGGERRRHRREKDPESGVFHRNGREVRSQ